jgi:hypothetical protein
LAGDLYSLNLQTGIVLVNGLPPRRLPDTILSMPVYLRTFANRNFEVVPTSLGSLKTIRAVGQCYYEFFVDPTGKLIVREHDGADMFELLDGTDVPSWGVQLPERLQKMHSHWYCREKKTIVLRPKHFDQRSVHFVLFRAHEANEVNWHSRNLRVSTQSKPSLEARGGGSGWVCCRVPEHLQSSKWAVMLADVSSFDQLVLAHEAQAGEELHKVQRVLLEFEPFLRYHHLFLDKAGRLLFELPRYGISFELVEGALHSRDFLSFVLAQEQQLTDALHGFQQYFILEKSEGDQALSKMIFPMGVVTAQSNAETAHVVIVGGTECDVPRKLHACDICPRFGTIKAPSIEARLQLAALYAATGTEVPEKRSQQTGGEMAIELVRQSWTQGRPASDCEHEQLMSLRKFGQRTPALLLLAHELYQSQQELDFLPGMRSLEELHLDVDAATEYVQLKQRSHLNFRAMLTSDEEKRTGSKSSIRLPGPPIARLTQLAPLEDVPSHMTSTVEIQLKALVKTKTPGRAAQFPLDVGSYDTALGHKMIKDLKTSWEADQKMLRVSLAKSLPLVLRTLDELLKRASL